LWPHFGQASIALAPKTPFPTALRSVAGPLR
jgi:hypothetical protein